MSSIEDWRTYGPRAKMRLKDAIRVFGEDFVRKALRPRNEWKWTGRFSLEHPDGRLATIDKRGLRCTSRGGWADREHPVPIEMARLLLKRWDEACKPDDF